ncbi:MAG: lyase family protein [Planctomycetota bacterium]
MTTSPYDTYQSPLASRNASAAMLRIWSPRHKFQTWRRIWLAVAEAQRACGLDITDEQIAELRAVVERGITDAELERAGELERELRHDVMAHVHCLGESAPKAKPILHLGCTSQDVVCNADLLTIHQAIQLMDRKVAACVLAFSGAAERWAAMPTLGFTHYQSAQPTTVGRRIANWASDILEPGHDSLGARGSPTPERIRGFKGATGTQASFLNLFGDDAETVDRFEAMAVWSLIADEDDLEDGFDACISEYSEMANGAAEGERQYREMFPDDEKPPTYFAHTHEWSPSALYSIRHTFDLTGQTYPRVIDSATLSGLASIAAVLHKIATDIRLLSNRKEIDEPFGDKQIGSSAMPYKRNPMRCERICGLARFVMNLVGNAYDTAATQWLERTLDDSSNRRLSLPEAFLALDGALDLMHNVASGLVVHEAMVTKNLMAELPFLATENILMEAVKAGGDRQDLHEKIRVHAQEAGLRVKRDGLDNDLIERLRNDPAFASVHDRLTDGDLLDPMQYVGRSVEQVERFVKEVVEPLRKQYADDLAKLEESEPRV